MSLNILTFLSHHRILDKPHPDHLDNHSKKEKFESINIRLTQNRSWREKVFAQTIVLADTGSFMSVFSSCSYRLLDFICFSPSKNQPLMCL